MNGYSNASLLVSGQELDDHLDESGIHVLDVRLAERCTAGYIPGTIDLPIAGNSRTLKAVPRILAPIEEVEQALG